MYSHMCILTIAVSFSHHQTYASHLLSEGVADAVGSLNGPSAGAKVLALTRRKPHSSDTLGQLPTGKGRIVSCSPCEIAVNVIPEAHKGVSR